VKRAIKISILGIVLLFFILSAAGFLILKTDRWKGILIGFVNHQLVQRYNLKIEPEGISGNILYSLKFDRLTLNNLNQTELITLAGVNLTYNIKSLIGRKHALYKLRIDSLSLAYPASIDSLLASLPESQDTAAATGNFRLESLVLRNGLITDSNHPGQILAKIDSVRGSLFIKADTIGTKLSSIDCYLAPMNESFSIRKTELTLVGKSLDLKGGQIQNRGTIADLNGLVSLDKPFTSRIKVNIRGINPAERVPALSRIFQQDDNFDLSGQITTNDKSIKLNLEFIGNWRGQSITEGRITGKIDDKQVDFPELNFASGIEQVNGSVSGRLDSSLTAEIHFNGIDTYVWGLSSINTNLQGKVQIQTDGPVQEINRIVAKIDLQESKIAPLDFNLIQGELVYQDGMLTILDTLYCALGETELKVDGEANLKDNTIDARAYFSALNAKLLASVLKIDTLVGDVDGFVEATGALKGPDLRGWFRGEQFGIPNLKFEESIARFGLVNISSQQFGDIFIEATNCQTNLIPEKIPLTSLIIHLEGDTTVVQTFKAVSENLDLEIKGYIVNFTDFNLNSIRVSRSGNVLQNVDPIYFSWKQDTIDFDAVRFRLNKGSLVLSGQVVKGDIRSGRLELANLSIDPLNAYLKGSRGVSGILAGVVTYKKDLNGSNYTYEISLKNAQLVKQNFKKINLQGQMNDHRILIENLFVEDSENGLLNGQGFLTCNLNYTDEQPFLIDQDSIGLELAFNHFNLKIINNFLLPNINISGKMDGQVNIYHHLGNPKMNYDLAVSDPVFDKLTGKEMTIKGIYQNERLSITEATLIDQYGSTRGRGYLPYAIQFVPARFAVLTQSPLNLNFSMKTSSLVFLTAYLDILEEVEGDISLALSISGTPEHPIRSGNISVKGTTVTISTLENPITGVNGSVVLKDNIFDIVSLTGYMKEPQSPGGLDRFQSSLKSVTWDVLFPPKIAEDQPNLAISGTIDFTKFFSPRYNIKLNGEELYIRTLLAEQEGIVTGTFTMTGQDTIVYEGNVELEDFILRNEFASKEKVIETEKHSKIYSIMNIQLAIPGSLELKNSQIDGELEGDMWLTRNGNEPYRFAGNLDILNGKFFAYGWEFEVVRGSISFDPVEFNPTLDIEAEVDLASYGMTDTTSTALSEREIVTVYLTGYLDNPTLEFESGKYSQSDILMFLTRAQNIGSDSFQQEQLSASAANVASMWFERQLERNVSRLSGLDDFELRTNGNLFSNRETDQWSVMLGRKIAPNLYVKYERTLSTEPNQQFGLEYRLNRNMSIAGDYGQDGYSINYRYKYRY